MPIPLIGPLIEDRDVKSDTTLYDFMSGSYTYGHARLSGYSMASSSHAGDHHSPTDYVYNYNKVRYPWGRVDYADGSYFIGNFELSGLCPLESGWDILDLNLEEGVFQPRLNFERLIVEAENKAQANLRLAFKNRVFDLNHTFGVDIAESRELKILYSQIKTAMKTCKKLSKAVGYINKSHPIVSAASVYLFYQFGVKPLVSAYKDFLAVMAKGVGPSTTFNGGGSGREMLTMNEDDLLHYEGVTEIIGLYHIVKKYTYTCRLSDLDGAIKSQLGLNVPYSSVYASLWMTFVLDWFVNIHNYLEAVEFTASNTGYTIEKVSSTTLYRKIQQKSYVTDSIFHRYDVQSFEKNVQCIRSTGLPCELPTPLLPTINVNLNAGKCLSLAAMIVTNISFGFKSKYRTTRHNNLMIQRRKAAAQRKQLRKSKAIAAKKKKILLANVSNRYRKRNHWAS